MPWASCRVCLSCHLQHPARATAPLCSITCSDLAQMSPCARMFPSAFWAQLISPGVPLLYSLPFSRDLLDPLGSACSNDAPAAQPTRGKWTLVPKCQNSTNEPWRHRDTEQGQSKWQRPHGDHFTATPSSCGPVSLASALRRSKSPFTQNLAVVGVPGASHRRVVIRATSSGLLPGPVAPADSGVCPGQMRWACWAEPLGQLHRWICPGPSPVLPGPPSGRTRSPPK